MTVLAGAALLAGGCGGGSSPSTPTPAPTPTPSSAVVVLDSGNFDSLVRAGSKPSLVEFHSPT
jgi:hypothetical protein